MKPEELIGSSVTSWGRTISEAGFTLLTDLTWLVAALHTDEEHMKSTSFVLIRRWRVRHLANGSIKQYQEDRQCFCKIPFPFLLRCIPPD